MVICERQSSTTLVLRIPQKSVNYNFKNQNEKEISSENLQLTSSHNKNTTIDSRHNPISKQEKQSATHLTRASKDVFKEYNLARKFAIIG